MLTGTRKLEIELSPNNLFHKVSEYHFVVAFDYVNRAIKVGATSGKLDFSVANAGGTAETVAFKGTWRIYG